MRTFNTCLKDKLHTIRLLVERPSTPRQGHSELASTSECDRWQGLNDFKEGDEDGNEYAADYNENNNDDLEDNGGNKNDKWWVDNLITGAAPLWTNSYLRK